MGSRSEVSIENQSQVVKQFEDDVLPIAGIMSLKSLNINSLMSVIKYKELTHTKNSLRNNSRSVFPGIL